MTTQIGTFIPLQSHNSGWGSNRLNHVGSFGIPGWNPNSILGQNLSHNPQNSAFLIAPAAGFSCGTALGEISQNILPNCSTVAFVPSQGQISGPSFAPVSAPLHGMNPAALLGLTPALQGLNQGLAGLSHSFATELSENNQEYVVAVDVPGIEIQDLDISLSGNTIHINGVRKECHEASTLAYSEVARGCISRAIAVPFDISPSKAINTSLENGVLKIRIAKEAQSERKSTARKVKIG
ncbi:MAG: Hsp20/alpha crystallin family protein [Alphaproteobacteria bacterium]|jgi:HSP20 family protein|nr:Hsp20/alpha crystallin family protein [Alphaproteobacteria bacterium]